MGAHELPIYKLIPIKSGFIDDGYLTSTAFFLPLAAMYPLETQPSPEVVYEGGPDVCPGVCPISFWRSTSQSKPHLREISEESNEKSFLQNDLCASQHHQGAAINHSLLLNCTHCGVTGREIKGDPTIFVPPRLSLHTMEAKYQRVIPFTNEVLLQLLFL